MGALHGPFTMHTRENGYLRKFWTRDTCNSPAATRMASVKRDPHERGDGPRDDASMQMEAAPDHVEAAARAENEEAAIGITNAEDAVQTTAAVAAAAAALQDVPGEARDQAAVILRAAVHAAADDVADVARDGLAEDCEPAGDKGSGSRDKADGGLSLVEGSSFFMSKASTAGASSVAVDGSKRKAVDGLSTSENVLGKKVKVESAAAWNEACATAPAHVTRAEPEKGPHGNLDAYVAAVKAVEDVGTSSFPFEVQLQNLRDPALDHGTVMRLLTDKTLSVDRYLARSGKTYRKAVLWAGACVKAMQLMEEDYEGTLALADVAAARKSTATTKAAAASKWVSGEAGSASARDAACGRSPGGGPAADEGTDSDVVVVGVSLEKDNLKVPTASYMAGLAAAGSTVGDYGPVGAAERMASHAEDVAAPNSTAVHVGGVVLAARTAANAGTIGNNPDTAQYAGRMGVAKSAAVGTGKIGAAKSTSGHARGPGEAGSNNRN